MTPEHTITLFAFATLSIVLGSFLTCRARAVRAEWDRQREAEAETEIESDRSRVRPVTDGDSWMAGDLEH